MTSVISLREGILHIAVAKDEDINALKERIYNTYLGEEVKKVVFDFSNLKFLGTPYLALLIGVYKKSEGKVKIVVKGVDKELFSLTRLDKIFEVEN